MKKIILVACMAIFGFTATAIAQPPGGGQMDPAQLMEMMKQRVKPGLIEKTKITDAQADKVLEVYMWTQGEMRGMRDMSEEDRAKKMKEVGDERAKKLKAIPLTDDQVKSVGDYLDEMRRNRGPRN